jgi:hypothetical protein
VLRSRHHLRALIAAVPRKVVVARGHALVVEVVTALQIIAPVGERRQRGVLFVPQLLNKRDGVSLYNLVLTGWASTDN